MVLYRAMQALVHHCVFVCTQILHCMCMCKQKSNSKQLWFAVFVCCRKLQTWKCAVIVYVYVSVLWSVWIFCNKYFLLSVSWVHYSNDNAKVLEVSALISLDNVCLLFMLSTIPMTSKSWGKKVLRFYIFIQNWCIVNVCYSLFVWVSYTANVCYS